MGRLGLEPAAFWPTCVQSAAAPALRGRGTLRLMTHLASADDSGESGDAAAS